MEEKQKSFHPILTTVYDSLLKACDRSAIDLIPSDKAIVMFNNIHSMKNLLKTYDFVSDWVGILLLLLLY